ncbi:MAG: hypothetical protein R2867_25435 [Caldilineaceae bacterium]
MISRVKLQVVQSPGIKAGADKEARAWGNWRSAAAQTVQVGENLKQWRLLLGEVTQQLAPRPDRAVNGDQRHLGRAVGVAGLAGPQLGRDLLLQLPLERAVGAWRWIKSSLPLDHRHLRRDGDGLRFCRGARHVESRRASSDLSRWPQRFPVQIPAR